MVTISKPSVTAIALIGSTLFSLSNAWLVGIYASQNSCGGDGAPDTERGGVAKQTTQCTGHGIIEVKALNISDWDTGCKVVAYDSFTCANVIKEYNKEDYDVVDDNWSCINNQADTLANFQALRYICE